MTERTDQSTLNLQLAIERCRQDGLKIWETTTIIQNALLEWARRENLEVKVTVVAK